MNKQKLNENITNPYVHPTRKLLLALNAKSIQTNIPINFQFIKLRNYKIKSPTPIKNLVKTIKQEHRNGESQKIDTQDPC